MKRTGFGLLAQISASDVIGMNNRWERDKTEIAMLRDPERSLISKAADQLLIQGRLNEFLQFIAEVPFGPSLARNFDFNLQSLSAIEMLMRRAREVQQAPAAMPATAPIPITPTPESFILTPPEEASPFTF